MGPFCLSVLLLQYPPEVRTLMVKEKMVLKFIAFINYLNGLV
jgi:hypothetical protein